MLQVVLNGVYSLGDIRDVEKLCDRIATQAFGQRVRMTATTNGQLAGSSSMSKGGMSRQDHEELVAFLIAEAWLLSLRYDEGHGAKFSTFAIPQLRMRVVDWQRRKIGRKRPGREAKDNPGEWGVLSTGDLDEHELERSLGSGERDDPASGFPDLMRILSAGSGRESGPDAAGGKRADGRAA